MDQSPTAGAPVFRRLPGNGKDTTQKVVLQASSFLHDKSAKQACCEQGLEDRQTDADFM